jgi:CelD/BcsL family acetyltransferase involved in cellulose biosynthesis
MLAAQNQTDVSPSPSLAGDICTVRVCHTWGEFEQLRADWNRLLHANPASSIFQTPEWLGAWWEAFGNHKRLCGLVFLDSESNVLGIAPLYAEQKRFLGRSLTTLRMVGAGSGDSDALDFTTAPGYERLCSDAFIAWLRRQKDWHICSLETLPQDSLMAKQLFLQTRAAGWSIDHTLTPNFIVDLPETWPQYLGSLEPSFRPLLTRYPKRLQSRYRVNIVRCERVQDLETNLQELFALHQMRWTGQGEPGAFASIDRQNFYSRMARAFLERGWLEFWLLYLNDEIVGAQFCFRYNATVSLLQEGFHPRYTADKIGYALRAHVLEVMIGTGARHYDFLGGDDAYKAKFGARRANYFNLSFAIPSTLGHAYLVLQRRKRQIKIWLKSILPASRVARLGLKAPRVPGNAKQI